jgi:hypothetical protein
LLEECSSKSFRMLRKRRDVNLYDPYGMAEYDKIHVFREIFKSRNISEPFLLTLIPASRRYCFYHLYLTGKNLHLHSFALREL